jgi:hypothetical protein
MPPVKTMMLQAMAIDSFLSLREYGSTGGATRSADSLASRLWDMVNEKNNVGPRGRKEIVMLHAPLVF